MEKPQTPIPRPAGERWRDIRLGYVPVAAYLVCIGLVIYLWNSHWTQSTFVGEVQGTLSNVTSAQDGRLVNLSIRQFDPVTKGQILGKVAAQTQSAANAGLAAIRADLEVMQPDPRCSFVFPRADLVVPTQTEPATPFQ